MGKKVILAPGLDGCVSMYTEGEWKKLAERLGEGSMLRSDDRNFNRFIFGGAVETDIDTAGRILVPDFLKDRAVLGAKVSIIGVQNRAEIWNEKKWKEYKKSVESQADALAEKLGQIGVL